LRKRILKRLVSREVPCRQHGIKEKLGKGQINILRKIHHPEVPFNRVQITFLSSSHF
jgi:hypothetical protein